jgi:3-dehydroquinate synthase class II
MRGHMLDMDLLTLDLKIFENIQDFFTKFKDLLLQLKSSMVDKSKEEKQMVLIILSKIGPELFVFISAFHTVRLTSRATWKIHPLEDFIESLTQEKTKLINIRTIKGPRAHALTVHDGNQKY